MKKLSCLLALAVLSGNAMASVCDGNIFNIHNNTDTDLTITNVNNKPGYLFIRNHGATRDLNDGIVIKAHSVHTAYTRTSSGSDATTWGDFALEDDDHNKLTVDYDFQPQGFWGDVCGGTIDARSQNPRFQVSSNIARDAGAKIDIYINEKK